MARAAKGGAGKEVARTGTSKAPAVLTDDYSKFEGRGMEGVDRDSFAIPFIIILQSGSPQLKKADPAYIEDAEEGFIFNTVTQEVLDGDSGIMVVPCAFQRRYLQWADREYGAAGAAGFRGEHLPTSKVVAEAWTDEDGRLRVDDERNKQGKPIADLLVDTRTHYVIIAAESGVYAPAVLAMASTQVKKSKGWMSRIDAIKYVTKDGALRTPPSFAHMYRMTTVPESNDQGSWYGWKVGDAEKIETDSPLFAAAEAFNATVNAGNVKVAERVQE